MSNNNQSKPLFSSQQGKQGQQNQQKPAATVETKPVETKAPEIKPGVLQTNGKPAETVTSASVTTEKAGAGAAALTGTTKGLTEDKGPVTLDGATGAVVTTESDNTEIKDPEPQLPSTGDEWKDGIKSATIKTLGKISTEIDKVVAETADTLARNQIRVGRLLNEARVLIPSDKQFGAWRATNTQITNKSTANKLMNLAAQVGDGRITHEMVETLPLSTLKELISAPASVLATVQEKVQAKEKVSRQDIRDASGGKPPEPKAPNGPAKPPEAAPRGLIEKTLEMSLVGRVATLSPNKPPVYKGIKPVEHAYLVFGLDPDPSVLPNFETLEILATAFYEKLDEKGCGVVKAALATIKLEY